MTNSSDPIIRDLEIMADTVNYRGWMYSNIRDGLGKRVVELGAGIGNFTQLLTDRDIVVAVDNSELAVEQMKKKFAGLPNVTPILADIGSPELVELRRYEADTIVCINVLEHICDDKAALSSMLEILEPGGKLILLVPAYQFLFGTIDVVVGHYRRYSKKELVDKLVEAGFEIKGLQFMNVIGVFAWFLNNRILKRKEESPAQMATFDRFVAPWAKKIEDVIKPPFGLSLIAIAEKK